MPAWPRASVGFVVDGVATVLVDEAQVVVECIVNLVGALYWIGRQNCVNHFNCRNDDGRFRFDGTNSFARQRAAHFIDLDRRFGVLANRNGRHGASCGVNHCVGGR